MAYNLETARQLANSSARMLRYWDKIGLVRPSVSPAKGRGSKRLYSLEDLVEMRTVARLRTVGVSLQKIRKVVGHMREARAVDRPLARLRFLTDGESVFVSSDDRDRWEDVLNGSQVVWLVPVDEVWRDTENSIRQIGAPTQGTVKVGRRSYTVVYQPDLEDGGWVVECLDIPGCVSQGDSLAEAREMIADAIAAMVAAPAEVRQVKRAK